MCFNRLSKHHVYTSKTEWVINVPDTGKNTCPYHVPGNKLKKLISVNNEEDKNPIIYCAHYGCNNLAECGGHVYRYDEQGDVSEDEVYIVHICSRCNHHTKTEGYPLKMGSVYAQVLPAY